MLKLIFVLSMVFIIIYFFKVLKILLRARKNLHDININIKKKAQNKNNQGKNGQKTYTLSSDDYKVDK